MDVAVNINPKDKMIDGERMEKWVLRKALKVVFQLPWRGDKRTVLRWGRLHLIDTLKALVDTSVADA